MTLFLKVAFLSILQVYLFLPIIVGQTDDIFVPLDSASSSCFPNDTLGINANCSLYVLKDSSIEAKCIEPRVLLVRGEFQILKIICSANYPVDLYYFGIQPTEAIRLDWWRDIVPHSNRVTKTFHIEVKVHSVQKTYDLYLNTKRTKPLGPTRHIYTRTGKYVIRGIYNETLETSLFLYLEDGPHVQPSFLRNANTKISQVGTRLNIPCISSHFDGVIEVSKVGGPQMNFVKNPGTDQGFYVEILPGVNYLGNYACNLMLNGSQVDFMELNYQLNAPDYPFGMDRDVPVVGEVQEIIQLVSKPKSDGGVDISTACKTQHYDHPKTFFASIESYNHGDMRLIKEFVLPQFSNRSYSVHLGYPDDSLLRLWRMKELSHLRTGTTFCASGEKDFELVAYGVTLPGTLIKFNYGKEWATFDRENTTVYTHFQIDIDEQDKIIYANTNLTFSCRVNIPVVFRPTVWYTEWKNGSLIEEFIDYDWKGLNGEFSYFTKSLPPDVVGVYCFASYWYSYFWRNISMPLSLTVGEPAVIKSSALKLVMQPGFSNQMYCKTSGKPSAGITWLKNGEVLASGSPQSGDLIYDIPNVDSSHAGEYVCRAANRFGTDQKTFTVEIGSGQGIDYVIIIVIPTVVFFVTVVAAWIYVKYFRKEKIGLSRAEIEEFLKGELNAPVMIDGTKNEYAHEFAHMTAYNSEFEIPVGKFQVDQNCVVGSGAFGVVLRGIVEGESVAVKTTKKNADKSYLKALLSELKIMIYLGCNENIVKIMGAYTKGLNKGTVYIFVKYYSLGNLEKYLKSNRECYTANGSYQNLNKYGMICQNTFNFDDLVSWACEISSGMNYLASKRVIHGDLAARNILLDDNRRIKITDFGLSRQLYDYASYVKTQQEPLPWRWMALEALRDLTFSTQSDVWSFGITMWEIFSLGEIPYPGLAWTMSFVEDLDRGLRMSRPKHATDYLYAEVMALCWDCKPDRRITFQEIEQRLKALMMKSGSLNVAFNSLGELSHNNQFAYQNETKM